MSGVPSNRSTPALDRIQSQFKIHEDVDEANDSSKLTAQVGSDNNHNHNLDSGNGASPLSSSKFENKKAPMGASAVSKTMLEQVSTKDDVEFSSLMARLTMHQGSTAETSVTAPKNVEDEREQDSESPADSDLRTTRVIDTPSNSNHEARDGEATKSDMAEMLRLKQELEAAKAQLALQRQEIDQNRVIHQTYEQVMGPSPVLSGGMMDGEAGGPKAAAYGHTTAATTFAASRPTSLRPDIDTFSDTSDSFPIGQSHLNPNIRSAPRHPFNLSPSNQAQYQQAMGIWQQAGPNQPWSQRNAAQAMPPGALIQQQQQRAMSGPVATSPGVIGDGRFPSDYNHYQTGYGMRRGHGSNPRNDGYGHFNRHNGWPAVGNGVGGLDNVNMGLSSGGPFQTIGMYQATMPCQPRPIGTPLSPTAEEFRSGQTNGTPWNANTSTGSGSVYVHPVEPINYRRLLDRSISCNWKYIVDKIINHNDQQASIFLQQKLKLGTVEQKYEIVESIVAQAYPLMVNRFGNFLVQRCFEHGTPEQVVAIANAIRGNTLSLSMDAFGCHVVQKAFDAVPEDYKAIMVHELLRRIPDTVIHRYACHVWQKLFELRWNDSPPQIMKSVNEALRGMWHDVALGETGSLVVQNIFENCLEEDKRPCIDEVLNNIDLVAHGQFGNWCIQHICEHGEPKDRSRTIDHVLRYATEYSMDQFASKVVEKCLKIGGNEFLGRYLERVCECRPDRPRIPLIDIASDQYGNYLIQWILGNSNGNLREVVAANVRRHLVSLRGSKFGSRVAMLCCNPAVATHPGPGVGLPNNRFASAPGNGAPRYGGAYR